LYSNFIKPFFDRLTALLLLIILSPVMLLTAIAIRLSGSRVLFSQIRPGKNEKLFRVYKFRTMTDRRDAEGNLLSDAQRLTRTGKFIRKTSLDELPQLWNVLRGNMSFVGPRPLLTEYLPLYTPAQSVRHSVKPGITGWAQINGRNSITWQQKFELDTWYAVNLSFSLDFKILFLTLIAVVRAKDINSPRAATMEKFDGTN
jgi:lipopolysaccharide/colanic/teichoic acid biosynthesis glycosyltransferase